MSDMLTSTRLDPNWRLPLHHEGRRRCRSHRLRRLDVPKLVVRAFRNRGWQTNAQQPSTPSQTSTPPKSTNVVVPPAQTTTPTKTTAKPPPAQTTAAGGGSGSGSGATAQKWQQCGGGAGYTGPTKCASGLTCTKHNDWYSQCL